MRSTRIRGLERFSGVGILAIGIGLAAERPAAAAEDAAPSCAARRRSYSTRSRRVLQPSGTDTWTIAGVAGDIGTMSAAGWVATVVSLGLVALLACYVPARRASRTDPILALRES